MSNNFGPATKPDALLIGGPSPSTALLIDQARADVIAKILRGAKMRENAIGVAAVTDIPSPAAKPFDKKYTDAYKRTTAWESVLIYNGMAALARAIEAAGTVNDARAIREAFPKAFPMLTLKMRVRDGEDFLPVNYQVYQFIRRQFNFVKIP